MSNLFKKLFKESGKGCCNAKVEEVKTEDKNKSNACCTKEKTSKKCC